MAKPRKPRKRAGTPSPLPQRQVSERPGLRFDATKLVLAVLVIALLAINVVTYAVLKGNARPGRPLVVRAPVPGAESRDRGLRDFKVVNAHEHLFARKHLDKYLAAADETGIVRTLFVASSEYTLKGARADPTEGNDWNSDEMLRVAKEFPKKIVPFCTIHPSDPQKLEKVKKYVAQGAKGLKLYTGHSNFWDRPLDTEEMMPVYAYCEQTGLPICWHINLVRYADEFSRVMLRFPEMIVIVPHFGVTFYRPTQKPWHDFQRMLDAYPNLYTDTSFGTREILVHGLEVVSRNREVFRAFFDKYSDRTFWGTDMVVTGNKEKTAEWIEAVLRACRDWLEKDSYHFFMAATGSRYAYKPAHNVYGKLRGLALPDDILHKVYETNFETLFPSE